MRFSVRWLKSYLQTDLTAQEIAEALTDCGLEVESITDLGLLSGNVVVGEILKIEPVEGADKIRLCTVMADRKEPLKIICGAQNISEGDRVPVAKFGMVFPDGFELKPRKIMGIEGEGMLCSAKELGLGDDHSGIWLLPKDARVAEPFDAVIEISITPNRPDALSIIGIAREIAAKVAARTGKRPNIVVPDLSVEEDAEKVESAARVQVPAKEDCPRYCARVIKGVKIGPSPRWLQVVLESAGMRPINNVVDVTNFVMLELGHPLHAFDLEQISDHTIVVRRAQKGESIVTLDEQEHALEETDLLIADTKRGITLAGIMGGANSEIGEETTEVLLECAYFRPSTVRKTSKRLGKSTDSSYRFERGMDPKRLHAAINRAAELIQQVAGGRILRGIIDVVGSIPEKEPVTLKLARLNKALGIELTGKQVLDLLAPLGFEVLRSDREEMQIAIPSHRVDVSIEADLVEEIARIYGYDRIPEAHVSLKTKYHAPEALDEARRLLSDAAVALGFHQAINFSFVREGANGHVGLAGDGREVRIQNPVTADTTVMRRSMLPSLLQNVELNLNKGVEDIALFEVGHVYEFEPEDEPGRGPGDFTPAAVERPMFAAVLAGGGKADWRSPAREHDFFEIKGATEQLLHALGHEKLVVEETPDVAWLHPGRAARFLVKGQPLAIFGEVHPALLRELDIKKRALYLEIALTDTVVSGGAAAKFKDLPRFPAITRDIALVVDRDVRSLDLERAIRKAAKNLLSGVRLFDVYEGEHVDAAKKSLAFSLTYRAADRTLKEEEVTEVHTAVLEVVQKEFGAALRG